MTPSNLRSLLVPVLILNYCITWTASRYLFNHTIHGHRSRHSWQASGTALSSSYVIPADICRLPIEEGSCTGNFSRWGYNTKSHSCEQFNWSGCEGNRNQFKTQAACQVHCGALIEVTQSEPEKSTESNEEGTATLHCVYYSKPSSKAEDIINLEHNDMGVYICVADSPLGGGSTTRQIDLVVREEDNEIIPDCLRYEAECVRLNCQLGIQHSRSADGHESCRCYDPELDCRTEREECNKLTCKYGMEKTVETDGCERCECKTDPCTLSQLTCSEDERCVVVSERHSNIQEAILSTECRRVVKPGLCPVDNTTNEQGANQFTPGLKSCQKHECDDDADCDVNSKCCMRECKRMCLEPMASNTIPTTLSTTPTPASTTTTEVNKAPDCSHYEELCERLSCHIRTVIELTDDGCKSCRCFTQELDCKVEIEECETLTCSDGFETVNTPNGCIRCKCKTYDPCDPDAIICKEDERCVPHEEGYGECKKIAVINSSMDAARTTTTTSTRALETTIVKIWSTETEPKSELQTTPKSQTRPGTQMTPKPQTTPQSKMTLKSQTTSESRTTSESQATPRSQTTPESQPTPNSQTAPESQTTPKSQTTRDSQTVSKSQTTLKTQTTPESQISPKSETTLKSQTIPESEPTPKSQITPESQTTPKSQTTRDSQTASESRTTPLSQATSKSETAPASQTTLNSQTTPKSQTTLESQTTPTSQTSPKSETTLELQTTSKSQTTPESQTSPVLQTTPKSQITPESQTTRDLQNTPESETTPKSQTEPESQTKPEQSQSQAGMQGDSVINSTTEAAMTTIALTRVVDTTTTTITSIGTPLKPESQTESGQSPSPLWPQPSLESNININQTPHTPDCSRRVAECARLNCEFGTLHLRNADGCERCHCFSPEIDCKREREDCNTISCEYGKEITIRADGSKRCVCKRYPCGSGVMTCQEGERCVLVPDLEGGYFAECRNEQTRVTEKVTIIETQDTSSEDTFSASTQLSGSTNSSNGPVTMRAVTSRKAASTTSSTVTSAITEPSLPEGCAAFKFGCCHDNKTEALGPDNQGCPDEASPVTVPNSVNLTCPEGGKATLRCLYPNKTSSSITWKRGNLTIDVNAGRYRLNSNGALEIVFLYRNDTGVYTCTVDDGHNSNTQLFNLVVKDPEETSARIAGDESAVITDELGKPLVLRCLAYGYPKPEIFWWRYNEMVPYYDKKYEIRRHLLIIRSLANETLGQYTCQAYNGVGQAASWVMLVRSYSSDGYILAQENQVAPQNISTIKDIQPSTTLEITSTTSTMAPTTMSTITETPILSTVTVPNSVNLTCPEGGKATLRCLYPNKTSSSITWKRGNLTIDVNAGRYRLNSNGALEIVFLYRNDTGVYSCTVDDGHNSNTQLFNLVVKDPEETSARIAGDESAVITDELGKPLVLRCLAYGYPKPEIFWWRYNEMVPYYDKKYEIRRHLLIIRSLANETLGQYTCQAYNGVGQAASWVMLVRSYSSDDYILAQKNQVALQNISTIKDIQPSTTLEITSTTSTMAPTTMSTITETPILSTVTVPNSVNLTCPEGGMATLRCLYPNKTSSSITWKRGNLTIDVNAGRYRLNSNGALEIVFLYRNDTGVYSCTVDDGHNSNTQLFNLVVTDPEETSARIAGDESAVITDELGKPLVLRCLAYGYPKPEIFWWRYNEMVPYYDKKYEIRRHLLIIRSLANETLGQYTCQAYNGVGQAASWVMLVRSYSSDGYILAQENQVAPQNISTIKDIQPSTTLEIISTTSTMAPTTMSTITETPILSTGDDDEVSPDCFAYRTECERLNCEDATVNITRTADGCERCQCVTPKIDCEPFRVECDWIRCNFGINRTVGPDGCERCECKSLVNPCTTGLANCLDNEICVAVPYRDPITGETRFNAECRTEIIVPENCTDNPFFANCLLIVYSKFCTHKYYSRFCCKSCVQAGQLNPKSPWT